jgi:hypothetical protein
MHFLVTSTWIFFFGLSSITMSSYLHFLHTVELLSVCVYGWICTMGMYRYGHRHWRSEWQFPTAVRIDLHVVLAKSPVRFCWNVEVTEPLFLFASGFPNSSGMSNDISSIDSEEDRIAHWRFLRLLDWSPEPIGTVGHTRITLPTVVTMKMRTLEKPRFYVAPTRTLSDV